MKKTLFALGLAGLFLAGSLSCSPADPSLTASPQSGRAVSPRSQGLSGQEIASLDLMEPAPERQRPGLSLEAEVAGRAQQGHQAERELSAVAKSRSDNWQVREIAYVIERDHKEAEQRLRRATLTALPGKAQLPAEEKALKRELVKLDGAAFDRAYIDGLVKGHQKTLAMYREQSRKAPTEALRGYFQQTRPVIEQHLRSLKTLQARVR